MKPLLLILSVFIFSCNKVYEKSHYKNVCDFAIKYSESKRTGLNKQVKIHSKKDSDKDGVIDARDNCPFVFNPDQKDINNNKIGDACEVIPGYVAYIEFNGYYLNNPLWNFGVPLQLQPSMLYQAEIDSALTIVYEDYRNFNVIITTDSLLYNKTDSFKRQKMVVTQSYEWFGSQAGGVSYTGSMFWGDNTPGFIFSSLLNFNPKYIGEIISHELGHTIGLHHQSIYNTSCSMISIYNTGDNLRSGIFSSTYAPIMGNSLNAKYGIWWIGASQLSCNDIQNDSLIIANNLK